MNARATLAGAVLVLAACSEPGEPICSTQQIGSTAYVRQGQQVTVRAGLQVQCFVPNQAVVDRPLRVVKEVEVEVLDPDNQPVMATSTAPVRSGGITIFDVTTDVTFMVDKPGPWTVVARFEPNVGRSQLLVRTLAFRADAGVRELPNTLPAECTEYGLTASGIPVCTFESGFREARLAIGAQRIAGAVFAIDGDAIWVMGLRTDPRVERLVPTDGGLWAASHRFTPPAPLQPEHQLAAGRGQAYFYDTSSPHIQRLLPHPDDAGFAVANVPIGSGRLPVAVAAGTDVTLVLANANASSGSSAQVVLAFLADGGSQVVSAGATFLQRWSEDDGTMWLTRTDFTMGVQQSTVVAFDAPGGLVRSGSVGTLTPMGFQVLKLMPQAPVVRVRGENNGTWVVLPVLGGPQLGLEAFPTGPGYTEILSATRRHAFARSTDGTKLKVFDR